MFVNPIQQTPLAYDPARQVLTPPAPVDAPAPPQPPTPPIQQGDTPQDKFQGNGGGSGRGQASSDNAEQQKAATAEQLRTAWLRLQQLKQEANQALLAGDARGAKEAAQEAAQVATSIESITGSSPDTALGPIEIAAQQLQQHNITASLQHGGGQPGDQTPGDETQSDQDASALQPLPSIPDQPSTDTSSSAPGSVIDIARAGLGTAKDVVDAAASLPTHAVADRVSIHGYKQAVLDAIAGVEAIAARVFGGGASSAANAAGRVDIRA